MNQARAEQGAAAAAAVAASTTPWWRIRMLWLVIGGPAAVVLASFATLGLALKHPDPIVTIVSDGDFSKAPAMQARNHAAVPQAVSKPAAR